MADLELVFDIHYEHQHTSCQHQLQETVNNL